MTTGWKIEIEDTRRPCIDKDGKRCLFHRWSVKNDIIPPSMLKGGHSGGTVCGILGILEYEDGSIKQLYPENFRFDDGGQFGDFIWFSDVKKEEKDE